MCEKKSCEYRHLWEQEYLKKVRLVTLYIDTHLEEKITLAELAAAGGLSPFHLHRIVSAFLGEPIGAYITRQRVARAINLLRYSDLSIQEIAYTVGYDAPSSLTKAFKKAYNIAPSEFRTNKNLKIMTAKHSQQETYTLAEVEIVERVDKRVAYIQVIGAYGNPDCCKAWGELTHWAGKNGLLNSKTEFLGVSHDDPNITEESKCRYDACVSLEGREAKPEGKIGIKIIEGGMYATFLHLGEYERLILAYNAIYTQWLPQSGYSLKNAPIFEEYLNNANEVASKDLKTIIYIPIEKK